MKLESILNKPAGPSFPEYSQQEEPSMSAMGRGCNGSSFPLPTPSPEGASSGTAGESLDITFRTPWDAGGYSLARETGSKASSISPIPFGSPRERTDSVAIAADGWHTRHVSIETPPRMAMPCHPAPFLRPTR